MVETDARLLPIFPLPLVLFPGMRLPLHIFEPKYQELMADIMDEGHQEFGVTLYLKSAYENVGITTAIGTIARVIDVEPKAEGRMDIVTTGMERFKITDIDSESKSYLQGYVELYEDDPDDQPDGDLVEEMKSKYVEMVRLSYKILKRDKTIALSDDITAEELSYRIGEHLNQDITLQQGLLELQSTRERLSREQSYVDSITQRLAAMSQINQVFDDPAEPSD